VHSAPGTLAQNPFTIRKDRPEKEWEEEARIQNPVVRSKEFPLSFHRDYFSLIISAA
jgi:hypothetical protein